MPGFIPAKDFVSDEDQFGGIGGQVAAGALGLLRGTTLSASDVLLTKSGLVSPETLKGLEQANPVASIAGEIGSVFVPGGAASLVSKAGKAVYGGAKALKTVKDAHNASLAMKALGVGEDILAQGLGSAVEGAIYAGIGNTLNEYALGDPGLNAEKILGHFGQGAVLGGAFGAAIKGTSIAVPEALRTAREGLVKLRDVAIGSGEKSAGIIGKIAPEGKLTEALANRATNLDDQGRNLLFKDAADAANTAHKNIMSTLKDLNKKIRPKELEALIETADPKLAVHARQNVITALDKAYEKMKNRPAIYSANVREKLEDLRLDIVHGLKSKKTPIQIFNHLKEIDQRLFKIEKGVVYSETSMDTKALLKEINELVGSTMKNPDVFGVAGASYAEHNRMLAKVYEFISPTSRANRGATDFQKVFGSFDKRGNWSFDPEKVSAVFKRGNTIKGQEQMAEFQRYMDTLKELPDHIETAIANVPNVNFGKDKLANIIENAESTFPELQKKYLDAVQNSKNKLGLGDLLTGTVVATNPVIGAALGAYNIWTKPFESLNKLAEIERIIGKTTQAVGRGAKSIFDPTLKLAGRQKGVFAANLDDSQEDADERYDEIFQKIAQVSSDPNYMIEKLNESTDPIYGAAPDIATNAQRSLMTGAQFLASKIPKPTSANPFDAAYAPSKAELAQFQRYLSIVERPMSALDQVRSRTVTPETVETLSVVYPKLYEFMKQAVLAEASKLKAKNEEIPYQTKQSISMFLGEPLDQSMLPLNVAANQDVFDASQMAMPQLGSYKKISLPNIKSMTLSSRTGLDRRVKD